MHPFLVSASKVLNQKSGFLLYSPSGRASTPFQGGTLCLAPPLVRTAPQSSGGNVGPVDCSGAYAYAFYVLRAWQGGMLKQDLSKWKVLQDYFARLGERPAVRAALEAEAAPV